MLLEVMVMTPFWFHVPPPANCTPGVGGGGPIRSCVSGKHVSPSPAQFHWQGSTPEPDPVLLVLAVLMATAPFWFHVPLSAPKNCTPEWVGEGQPVGERLSSK